MEQSLGNNEGYDTVEEVKTKISELDNLIADATDSEKERSNLQIQKKRNSLISQRKYYRKKLKMVTLIAEKNKWIARNEKVKAHNAQLTLLLRQAQLIVAQHNQAVALQITLPIASDPSSSLFPQRPLLHSANEQQSLSRQLAASLPCRYLHTQQIHPRALVPPISYPRQLNLLDFQVNSQLNSVPLTLPNINTVPRALSNISTLSSLSLQQRILLAQGLVDNTSLSDLLLQHALSETFGLNSASHNDPTRRGNLHR
jgi:hypothetical protein